MAQKTSKISQIKWCQENNVNIHNFRYWVGRLKDNESKKENKFNNR